MSVLDEYKTRVPAGHSRLAKNQRCLDNETCVDKIDSDNDPANWKAQLHGVLNILQGAMTNRPDLLIVEYNVGCLLPTIHQDTLLCRMAHKRIFCIN